MVQSNMSIRKFVFWTHLMFGATAGILILVMSFTGALLAFAPQIQRFADRQVRTVAPPSPDAARLGPDELFVKIRAAQPEARPEAISLEEDRAVAATVTLGRENFYVNPYTGEVLGTPVQGVRNFFRTVTDWHRALGFQGEKRNTARLFTGGGNLAFCGLALSGIILWWPKTWSLAHVKPATAFQAGLRGKARHWNWHNVIGIWMWPVLLIMTSTGVVLSYPWANNLLYSLTGSPLPSPVAPPSASRSQASAFIPGEPKSLNELWQRADAQAPGWHRMLMRIPAKTGDPVTFLLQERDSWSEFQRSQLLLDRFTGEVVRWEPYAGLSAGRRLRTWFRFSHTGEMGGIIGQALAGVACVGGVFLVYTGISLALRRFFAWARRRKGQAVSVAAPID